MAKPRKGLDSLHIIFLSFIAILAVLLIYFVRNIHPIYTDEVVEVVDGDTFFIKNRQPIRLFGINAPEIGDCFSEESKTALTKLILNKKVQLTDLQADRYGRVLAMVHVDGKLINLEMIKGGFAVYVRAPDQYLETMKQAGSVARDQKIGIFTPFCYQPTPPDPKCKIKGNHDEKSQTAKVYFKPSCAYYDSVVVEKYLGEQWFCTEAEAVAAGYIKSPNCK